MPTSTTVWVPASNDLSLGQALALSVPAPARPPRDEYNDLLAEKLQVLVDSDRLEAQRALEMSQEQCPEWWLIAEDVPVEQWGRALMSSESMQSRYSLIDWAQPGMVEASPEPQSLREILELMAA